MTTTPVQTATLILTILKSDRFSTLLCVSLLLVSPANSQNRDTCAGFERTIQQTYNFRPALLANDTERKQKTAAMDRFWYQVNADKQRLLPCLTAALQSENADSWFRFDGSNLLVSLDQSYDAKKLQVKSYAAANLDDVDLRLWVSTLAERGVEGLDTAQAAERWLRYPKARYFLPEHGAYQVSTATGALFLYGSMDEKFATPALLRIVNTANHPGAEIALQILLSQNTPESLEALEHLDLSRASNRARDAVQKELKSPDLFEPRAKPRTSRKEFLDSFQALLQGDSRSFLMLVSKVPDGEKDVVATLTYDDLTVVRQVRRRIIAAGNQHVMELYVSFTKIIRTIMRKGANTRSTSA